MDKHLASDHKRWHRIADRLFAYLPSVGGVHLRVDLPEPEEDPIEQGVYLANDEIAPLIEWLRQHQTALPRINIRCETRDGQVIGSTDLKVIRVECEDDGSYTAVTDHWPT